MTEIRDALQQTLGPTYTVERELGGGGMSRVFVAFDQSLSRRVAVKVVSPELAAAVSLDRFSREILVAATLQNPHIVGVLTSGEVDGLPYFTMPFIEGESLRAHMLQSGPMPVREVVTILRDVARALAYAHERGIVHRDIKPDNVLLASGSAMVTDFGVAKAVLSAQRAARTPTSSFLTQVGTTVGTPAYMAPEQIAADPDVDGRADIYSLGVMAYEMLAGGPPFAALTPQALLAAHFSQTPRPLGDVRAGLPPRLVALIMQCLEKDRDHRPQTAREIVNALEDPSVVSDGAVVTLSMPGRRRRRIGAVVVVLAVLGAAGVTLAIRSHRSPPRPTATRSADSTQTHAVLVVPFVNLSADSSDTYLADGITSELVSELTQLPGLRVALRAPAAVGPNQYPTEQELGTKYHVGYVLEGTVQQDGTRLRITARLVSTANGFSVWADVFDRTMRDMFTVQQDIASSIVQALEPQLASSPQALADRGTKDDTAYQAYTIATGYVSRRGARALHRAIDTLSSALLRDSTFAKAYALKAQAYALLPLDETNPADSAVARGIVAATRAIALDSTLADAYEARAALYNASFRWADAEHDYRKAIAIDPRNAASHLGLGQNLLVQGRVSEGVAELHLATVLDQTSATTLSDYAVALSIAGDQTRALAAARGALALDSTVYTTRLALGTVYVFGGHADSALAPLKAALGLATLRHPASNAVLNMLAYAYAKAGDARQARSIAEAAAKAKSPDAALTAAHAMLGAGDTTAALRALLTAARDRAPQLTFESLRAPIFDPIRSSPQFLAVLRSLGLSATLGQPAP